jgi:predicted Rossmann fold nucleotide-binding protein DprA/Smf involved in DNA uptake
MNSEVDHLRPNGTRRRQRTGANSQPDLFDWGATARATRAAAFDASKPKANERHERVFAYVASCGERGATREEVANSTGIKLQSVCSPVLALLREGRLREDGRTRLTSSGSKAAVFIAVTS